VPFELQSTLNPPQTEFHVKADLPRDEPRMLAPCRKSSCISVLGKFGSVLRFTSCMMAASAGAPIVTCASASPRSSVLHLVKIAPLVILERTLQLDSRVG
jgi:hypothetical protein